MIFQSAHPWGMRWTVHFCVCHVHEHFNPRIREGCDTNTVYNIISLINFNPRIREGCDDQQIRAFNATMTISIRASVRDAIKALWIQWKVIVNFNPRIREGCDVVLFRPCRCGAISIRASVRDAIYLSFVRWNSLCNFNPRIREGCDLLFQSAHPWGMRCLKTSLLLRALEFQSAHPWGMRYILLIVSKIGSKFQSAHPWGMRCNSRRNVSWRKLHFNPRIREGCDVPPHALKSNYALISIRASVRDAISVRLFTSSTSRISIRASVRDAITCKILKK